MDVSEYGCNENINAKDDDSVVSEKCWKETRRGDSRKWLLRDGYRKKSDTRVSTMKATYSYPLKEEQRCIGERRALLLQKLYDEAADEIMRERNEPPPTEEYCTEYDGNYNRTEITKSEKEEETTRELSEKYPLYASPVTSYWSFKVDQNQRGSICIPGLTTAVDLKNPFKRYSGFTKPISEVLDESSQ